MRREHPELALACTLDGAGAEAQLAEWAALRDAALISSERIDGGRRVWFAADAHDTVADLARREAACCAFLSLQVSRHGDRTQLEVTSANPEAGPIIDLLVTG